MTDPIAITAKVESGVGLGSVRYRNLAPGERISHDERVAPGVTVSINVYLVFGIGIGPR